MAETAAAAMELPPPRVIPVIRPPGALPRRRFFSDMPDKGLFGLAAFIGFAAICALKVAGANADLVAVLAVALMVAYGMLAYRIPMVQMRLDRLGDNFYYLGFILTLASLSAALLQLRSGTEIDELLGSFGIALVTTIVGIAGRVMFVQLRGEIDDIEEQVRRDLAATSAELRAQLSASMREFETFRIGLLQTLNETAQDFALAREKRDAQVDIHAREASERLAGATTELHKQLNAVLREFEAFRTELGKASQKQVEQIEALAIASAEKVDAAFEASGANAQNVAKLVHKVAQGVDQAVRRLSSLEMPGQLLNVQFEKFARELEVMMTRLSAVVETATRQNHNQRRRSRWFGRK